MLNRSEYTANLHLVETRENNQAEANRRVRIAVARIRAEKAKREGKKNWWRVW